jgi:hypothetical protein
MDSLLFQKLRAWAFRRDHRHGRIKIKQSYFPSGKKYLFKDVLHENNWVLVGKGKTKGGKDDDNFLPKIAWVKSERFIKFVAQGQKKQEPVLDGSHF